MTKVALFDDLGGTGGSFKTTKEIIKYFENHPDYEIEKHLYWGPVETGDAKIVFMEWAANNSVQMSKWEWKGEKFDWSDRQIIVRPMDIEVYAEQYRHIDWKHVTDLVYTAKHIWEYMNRDIDFPKKYPNLHIHHIPLSVDMNEWKYKERRPGNKIAVIGKMWAAKTPPMIFQFLDLLRRSSQIDWEVHILGGWDQGTWNWTQTYRDNIIKALGLEKHVFLYQDHVPSVDEWLEDKNYLISFSQKDAFSLIIGEAMAKGIKTFPHNFWGAKDIWGKYVWSSMDNLCSRLMTEDYCSQEYHDFVDKNYSNKVIMKKWQDILRF